MISLKAPADDMLDAPTPHPYHWRHLAADDERLILTPQEFRNRWSVSKQQIARMCFCSPATVSRWFQGCSYYHEAGDEYKFRLGYVDNLWRSVKK